MRFPRDVRLSELAPLVFRAAAEGDRVARQMLDEMADEIVVTAIAAIRRLHVTTRDVYVVLGGGVFRSRDSRLMSRPPFINDRAGPTPRYRTCGPLFGCDARRRPARIR